MIDMLDDFRCRVSGRILPCCPRRRENMNSAPSIPAISPTSRPPTPDTAATQGLIWEDVGILHRTRETN